MIRRARAVLADWRRFRTALPCGMAERSKYSSGGTRWGNGAGKGDGWGGPATGAGSVVPLGPKPEKLLRGPPTREQRAAKAYRDMADAQIASEARETLLAIMRTAEREETQLAAACKLLDRIEGLPVARVTTTPADDLSKLSDAELQAALDRYRP